MRPNGNRNWTRSARRALLLTFALVALGAAPAAADRYAVPTGGMTSGGCGIGQECTLKFAIEGAGSGETVHVNPGNYSVSTPISGGDVTVEGGTSDDTTITGLATLVGGPVLTLDNSAVVKNLMVESRNSQVALDLSGTGDGLEIYSDSGNALTLRGGSTLTTSVVHSSAAGASAMQISGGLLSTTTVRRSTVVATGSGSTGLDASGLLAGATVRSSVVNGVSNDVVGALLNSVTLTYSAWRTSKSSYYSGGATNVDDVAVFTDPGNRIFEQALTSPTINKGESDGTANDLAGRARQIGAAVDIGAYEAPLPPTATTGTANTITATGATVPVTTNARTVSTQRWVEYGTDASLGQEAGRGSAGSGGTDVNANIGLTGLLPGTTYHYRAVAANEWGQANGATQTFSTLEVAPTPATAAASGVSAVAATLEGTVDRGGADTDAWFEWGETASYGNTTSVQDLGDGHAATLTGVSLTGLTPNTEYHYRVVAQNSQGRRESSDATFRTDVRAPIVTLNAVGGITTTGATVSGSVDPGGDSTDWQFDYGVGAYDQTAAGGTLTGTTAQGVTRNLAGLVPGTLYQYRLVADNAQGTRTVTGTFTTEVAAATAETGDADPLAARSATVNGQINLGGSSGTWRVEYGKTAAYGLASGPHAHGDSATDDDVSATLNGLEPATTYHYRLVADNSKGTAVGADATFTTPADQPAVTATRAHGIDRTTAHLAGTVDPSGADTTWHMEYGKSNAYGQTTAAGTVAAASGSRGVTVKVDNLEPGTTYHFRLVAENSAGTREGADKTFTTDAPEQPAQAPAAQPPAGSEADPQPERKPERGTASADDLPEPEGAVLGDHEPQPGEKNADGLPALNPTPPLAESANAAPAAGTVQVRVPGSDDFVTLTEGAAIPMGSVVDATDGHVTITSAADAHGRTQTANFGGSQFKLLQKKAKRPITDIVLTGGTIGCKARSLAKSFGADLFEKRRKYSRRRLWGRGHGRFRTRGRRAAATVRGTHWLTEDRCDGTLVRVRRGLVDVRDLVRKKTVKVPAGKQYFAKSKLSKREKRALKRKRALERKRSRR